jgi:hypothetical protein
MTSVAKHLVYVENIIQKVTCVLWLLYIESNYDLIMLDILYFYMSAMFIILNFKFWNDCNAKCEEWISWRNFCIPVNAKWNYERNFLAKVLKQALNIYSATIISNKCRVWRKLSKILFLFKGYICLPKQVSVINIIYWPIYVGDSISKLQIQVAT